MDWDDLRIMLAVARNRSLSAAARELGVRQSTMSRRLSAIEQRAGARLLTRTPAGYVLTTLGEAVRGHAERMEAEAIAAERQVQGRDVALSGVVRVTAVEVIANLLLPGAVATLHARYPGITVDVLTEMRALSLSRREADIAIRMTRFEGAELYARRIARLASALYAAPAYLAQHSWPDGEQAAITVLDDQAHLPEARWLKQMLPQARIALRANSRDAQWHAAIAGIGIACLPRYLGDAAPGLVRLDTAPGPAREVWLGVHADLRHMPRVRAVIEAIDAELARQRPRFDPA